MWSEKLSGSQAPVIEPVAIHFALLGNPNRNSTIPKSDSYACYSYTANVLLRKRGSFSEGEVRLHYLGLIFQIYPFHPEDWRDDNVYSRKRQAVVNVKWKRYKLNTCHTYSADKGDTHQSIFDIVIDIKCFLQFSSVCFPKFTPVTASRWQSFHSKYSFH